jgi:acetyl esterase/lipase
MPYGLGTRVRAAASFAAMLLLTGCGGVEGSGVIVPTRPLAWHQVEALPVPRSVKPMPYGIDAPQQFGELRLPRKGAGPYPLAILVHGGCWQSAYDYRYLRPLAQALADTGVATWTIEYRRLGDDNGGWPQTFRDVALAADYVRVLAEYNPIDTTRVISVGHSAGGQLALWLATRARLPADSPLHVENPLPLLGVVGLSAITDLASYRVGPRDSCHRAVDEVMGGTPDEVPLRYQQVSPAARLPLGVPQWFVHGAYDPIVSAESVAVYADRARSAGDPVALLTDAGGGHFEPAVPRGEAWAQVRAAVLQALVVLP